MRESEHDMATECSYFCEKKSVWDNSLFYILYILSQEIKISSAHALIYICSALCRKLRLL